MNPFEYYGISQDPIIRYGLNCTCFRNKFKAITIIIDNNETKGERLARLLETK